MELVWMMTTAFLLGLRHGLDLDHLATIDAITRTVQGNLSKMVGFLFSLGHGLVVTIVSLVIGSGLMQTHIPEWLDENEFFAVTKPEYIGGMPVRVELFAEEIAEWYNGEPRRGQFLYELLSMLVVNPNAVVAGKFVG